MLSKKRLEILTRTGPATPMGKMIRRYWLPALLSEEIPEPDCPPVQVRILGEELVAFRDSKGRIGLLDEHCSHRGTSLFYGRNEECGLRCIYHGWKYGVEGNVLETPAEPPTSNFRKKIQHTAYPTREAAGIIFAYMGPKQKMPLFPNYEWTQVPKNHTYVTKRLMECNYLQGIEGECDSSHLSYLHRTLNPSPSHALFIQDGAPTYEIEEKDFGIRLVAIRKSGSDKRYIRISSFVMPVTGCIPAGPKIGDRLDGFEIHMYVPADDTHSWRYDMGFARSRPVTEEDVHRRKQSGPDYRGIRNLGNHYLQDRQVQKTVNFTGIEDFLNHDACVTESMGQIYDRTREHLGVSDKGTIALRQFLLNALKKFQAGKEPPHIIRDPEKNIFPHISSIAGIVPSEMNWHQYLEYLSAGEQEKPGV